MQRQMVITVMLKDRPGIIADVTGAIYELNGDLADINQSLLRGYLTMTLMATFADDVNVENIRQQLTTIASEDTFEAIIREIKYPFRSDAESGLPEKTYIVTAQGQNRSGLVYGISSFCYDRDINILDLSTTLSDDQYTMVLQLDLSKIEDIKKLREELDDYADTAGMHVMMQHYDIFRVTNEVTLI